MGQDEENFLAKSRPSPYFLFVRSFMHLLVTSTVIEVNKLPGSPNRSAPPNSPPLAPASQEPALVARIRPRKEIA
jgi:hypothetical protein